jgi:hypothetical protein
MVSGLFPFAMLPAAKLLVKHLTIASALAAPLIFKR